MYTYSKVYKHVLMRDERKKQARSNVQYIHIQYITSLGYSIFCVYIVCTYMCIIVRELIPLYTCTLTPHQDEVDQVRQEHEAAQQVEVAEKQR